MDVGVVLVALPKRTAALAGLAEQMGFASLRVPDSQNLAPEVWGQLMLAAAIRPASTTTASTGSPSPDLLPALRGTAPS